MQSLYDAASLSIVLRLPCNFPAGSCDARWVAFVQAFSEDLASNITAIQARSGARDGAFLTACAQHEESCVDADFGGAGPGVGITIGGQTAADTLAAWRTASGAAADWRRRDVAWPGDATCAPNGARHGGC